MSIFPIAASAVKRDKDKTRKCSMRATHTGSTDYHNNPDVRPELQKANHAAVKLVFCSTNTLQQRLLRDSSARFVGADKLPAAEQRVSISISATSTMAPQPETTRNLGMEMNE
jgi:hypothetical protein